VAIAWRARVMQGMERGVYAASTINFETRKPCSDVPDLCTMKRRKRRAPSVQDRGSVP